VVTAAIQEQVFSGCSVAISRGADSFLFNRGTLGYQDHRAVGEETLFDLASLTKPLATTLAVLALITAGKLGLDDTLPQALACPVPADKEKITLFQLLNHCAGLAAHRPFYLQLAEITGQQRPSELLRLVLHEPLAYPVGSQALYSDLGFILLGLVVEASSGLSLDEAVARHVYEPLGLAGRLLFRPHLLGRDDVAATEHCPWRGRLLQGEVDDQNTWVIGGVSGQAGLFGSGRDVLDLVNKLTKIAAGGLKHPFLARDLLARAMRRQGLIKASNWGLGFDTPAETGSSAGHFISRRSCGHLGFTGTSFWHDFDHQISVVLLTNRVHPTVENNQIKAFRPLFHNLVFETLD
jgi:CubicO group peptidase (beta-lactamase class C family)